MLTVKDIRKEYGPPGPGRVVALEVVSGQTVEKGALLFCVE